VRSWTAALIVTLGTAHAALAQEGINLSWSDCGTSGVSNQNFACNANTGSVFRMFGSARVASAMSPVAQWLSTVDVTADAATLPAWWQMRNAGTCRQAAISYTVHRSLAPASCVDWELDTAVDAFYYDIGYGGPNHARMRVLGAGNPNSPVAFPANSENYLFSVAISRIKTVGAGSCAGCTVPACLTFQSVEFLYGGFTTSEQQVRTLTAPLSSAKITWQNGTGCFGAVPVRNGTWEGVKSLYR